MANKDNQLAIPAVQKNSLTKVNATKKKNKSNGDNKRSEQASRYVKGIDKSPSIRVLAERQLPIKNKLLHSSLKQFNIVGANSAMIIGALLRFKAFEGISHYEAYLATLINNHNTIIQNEIVETDNILKTYTQRGYEFKTLGSPCTATVTLFSSATNSLVDMYLYLDELCQNINYLEKCGHITSAEKIELERQWVYLPKKINSKIISVKVAIESQFDVELKDRNAQREQIDSKRLISLLNDYNENKTKVELLKLKPIPELKNITNFSPDLSEKSA